MMFSEAQGDVWFFLLFTKNFRLIHLTCQGVVNNTEEGAVKIINVSLKVSLKASLRDAPRPRRLFEWLINTASRPSQTRAVCSAPLLR